MTCLEETDTAPANPSSDDAPQYSRALLALLAAATIAVAPISTAALGPAGSGDTAHSSPVYLLAQLRHDIGHNEWAFQGGVAGRLSWVLSYAGLAVFWLAVALWMRHTSRTHTPAESPTPTAATTPTNRLWLKAAVAACAVECLAGSLTLCVAFYADRTSTSLGPLALRLADACSPWWSGVAALTVVAIAERNIAAKRAVVAYAVLLAVLLLVPLPGPDTVKVLILALPPAAAAFGRTGSRSPAGSWHRRNRAGSARATS